MLSDLATNLDTIFEKEKVLQKRVRICVLFRIPSPLRMKPRPLSGRGSAYLNAALFRLVEPS
jgi:hypothetical protein